MQLLLILGISSFLLSLVLTPLFRNYCRTHGIVDRPDKSRKFHESPVAHMGGIPLAVAYVLSFGVVWLVGSPALVVLDYRLAFGLIPAAGIVLLAGIVDDRYNLQPIQKLLVQTVAAVAAYAAGVRVTGIADHPLPLWLSLAITIVWLIACTNAFNLIDGMDGLAAGLGLFATATTLIAALMQHNLALAAATAPLAGALLGFLRYNFNPATIFLGDSGSLFIGFLLGCFGAIWSQKSATLLGMTAPLMALAIPILDTLLAVARRFLRRQPILRGDRGHIHHRLLARGLSPRRVVLLLYGGCTLGAVFSLLQSHQGNRYSGAVIIVFCTVAWVGVQNLGYVEFDQARRMIIRRGFREALKAQLTLRAFEVSFPAAIVHEQRWNLICEACNDLGFAEVHWHVNGGEYHDAVFAVDGEPAWSLRVTVGTDNYLDLTRAIDATRLGVNISHLADVMRRTLSHVESKPVRHSLAVTA